ncbi:Lateral signaling target protein 2-like protein [Fragariocoptes setiger]|uniref:Lateral signaling target protein 2-like protein n=1 Tax=Fragariocoptes setiger TaxID=1670756 RepID=A0ABQ7S8G5_9ACAR|nr:Lateral signaling target protein 2-like protein [Fragariocoptes setiger]
MSRRASRPCNFFKKLVVGGVNRSKASIQNNCLIKLYHADAELKSISNELDSFDGKKDPQRCSLLVNQLRTAQDKVINLLFQLMDECNCERASRDYRMKFPDEILLAEGPESLNGQIWFGAECLSAGSNILNHNKESNMLRPMAKNLTSHLDSLRNDLRELIIDGDTIGRIGHHLIKKMSAFDHIFATFEYEYVRTMLPIRSASEIEKLQETAVLFSEALIDAVKRNLIKQDDIDEFQPIVMIALPRLAIVRGLLYNDENPVYKVNKHHMSSLFKPFHGPLHSIRKLLKALKPSELYVLETMLANNESSYEYVPPPRPSSASDCEPSTDANHSALSSERSSGTASAMMITPSTSAPSPGTSSPPPPPPPPSQSSCSQEACIDELLMRQSQQLHHRLFVAISGVADQLQSNFASDLRFILRQVFNTSDGNDDTSNKSSSNDDDEDDDDRLNTTGSDCDDQSSDSNNAIMGSNIAHDHDASDNQPIEVAIEAREMTDLIDFHGSVYMPDVRQQQQQQTTDHSDRNIASATIDDLLAEPTAYSNNNSSSMTHDVPNGSSYMLSSRDGERFRNITSETTTRNSTSGISVLPHSVFTPTSTLSLNSSVGSPQHVVANTPETSSQHRHHSNHHHSSRVRRHRHHHQHQHQPQRQPAQRNPPIWVPDQLVDSCTFCNSSFSFFKRRHHCRDCGQIFCGECSKYTKNLQSLGYTEPQRVCVSCFQNA